MIYPDSFNQLEKWRDELRQTATSDELVHALENRIQQESDPERIRILNVFLIEEYESQGNEMAAEAVWSRDPVVAVQRWHDEWQHEHGGADIIPVLEKKIQIEQHPIRLSELRHLLAQEQKSRGNYASAAAIYLEDFNATQDALPLITLSEQKFYEESQPREAMSIIRQAVKASLRSGTFRRHALNVQARIALHLHDYELVEQTLRQLLDLKFTRGNADIAVERDFFDALPPGTVDPDIARQYDEYCQARGKRLGADTPKGRPPPE